MEIEQEDHGAAIVVKPKQRVDSMTAKVFEEHLMKAVNGGGGSLVVDFAELDYISSAGLRVVLMAAKSCKAKTRKFILCGMKPNILDVFKVSGFLKILTVVETRETALAAA